jgi:hypothetical protein
MMMRGNALPEEHAEKRAAVMATESLRFANPRLWLEATIATDINEHASKNHS